MKIAGKFKNSAYQKVKRLYENIYNYVFSFRMIVFLWVLFVGIVLAYVFLFFSAKKIETLFTFPGKDVNLKELTNHPAGVITGEEVFFTSSKGNTIHGMYIDNGADKTVFYFHGNGAPMNHFYTEMRYIADLGYNLISYDFPGYGKSTGEPTEEEIGDFSEIFYNEMKKVLNIEDKDLIVWGYSIGTALAIDFAKNKDFDSLILFSPPASRFDMSSKMFGFPLQKLFFLDNSLVSKESIKLIDEPTLIIHGNRDIVVPFDQGYQVYKNSSASEKYFIEIDDLGHSLITERYGEVLSGYIQDFLQKKGLNEEKTLLDRELASQILKKYQTERYIQTLDFVSDESYTKYVDPSVSFSEISYVPDDMRRLSLEYVSDTKGNAQMRSIAAENFELMARDFYEEMGEKMVVVSSYRSYAYQAGIKARGCPDNLCAKAGHSEHQTGLSVDLWSASTQGYWDSSERLTRFYKWLEENAHTYGFHNPYRNGIETDGYDIEPWHWRYVGERVATYLSDKDITFAELYYRKR